MRKACLLVVLLLLSGCVTFGQLERGLDYMMGESDSVAFNVLGYPSGKQEFGSDTVYYWFINNSGVVFVPQTSTTYGSVGTTSFYGTTSYSQAVPVNYSCQIKLIADSYGVLTRWEYNGNIGGCKSYIKRVNNYYKENNL
ncbi:hypothetical protein [Vibrio parahaemolyticus]|jgi:hypothetical protein|uniref:hypothetical protein n=1 Tax=Vibrio parahaemolyticus TaxID=670 RepID=UPI00046D66C8|nr:hypothetical protein [Vibrio parahaemolyticus]